MNVTIQNSMFDNNSAARGGALSLSIMNGASIQIINCTIANNLARDPTFTLGSALDINSRKNSNFHVVVQDCIFQNNSGTNIYSGVRSISISMWYVSTIIFKNCYFRNNNGNVMTYFSSVVKLETCHFLHNELLEEYGSIVSFPDSGRLFISHSNFISNKGTVLNLFYLQAFHLSHSTFNDNVNLVVHRGTVHAYAINNMLLKNCTFSNNKASY